MGSVKRQKKALGAAHGSLVKSRCDDILCRAVNLPKFKMAKWEHCGKRPFTIDSLSENGLSLKQTTP